MTRTTGETVRAAAATASPGVTRGAGGQATWGRWWIAWHGFFYLVLAYATGAALTLGGDHRSAGAVGARLALATALAAWYWLWLLGRILEQQLG